MAGSQKGTPKPPSEPRTYTPEEAEAYSVRLRKRIAEVENPNTKSARYNDPQVENLERSISATVVDAFGSTSVEGMRYGGFRFARQAFGRTSISLRGRGDNGGMIASDIQRQFVENLPSTATKLQGLIDLIGERTVVTPGETSPAARVATGQVFVVHGQREAIKLEVARTLTGLGLIPVILHEQANEGRTIIEKLEDHAAEVDFAVVLMTGDDVGGSDRDHLRLRVRQNVMLELGLFVGMLGRRRVCVLYEEGVEMPSDYLGVLYTPFDQSGAWRLKLVHEMSKAGLPVDANRLLGF
jgi:predicted nucleotide-binding protein